MSDVDEQEMRSYLLGSLSPEREAELFALIQGNARLREELLAVEAELFDDYVAGHLSAADKELFETFLLTTETGQENLRFAENFGHYHKTRKVEVTRAPAPNVPPIRSSSALFAMFRKHLAFAVLLIFLAALLITLGWLSLRKPRANSVAKVPPSGPVLQLAPGSLRPYDVVRLATPAKNEPVKLELELAKSDFRAYKTQLFRENEALESREELKTEPRNTHYVVPVTVTAEILTPGEYKLKLSGVPVSGEPEFIDSYSFRVTSDAADRGRLTR
jgi:hypothetical protein